HLAQTRPPVGRALDRHQLDGAPAHLPMPAADPSRRLPGPAVAPLPHRGWRPLPAERGQADTELPALDPLLRYLWFERSRSPCVHAGAAVLRLAAPVGGSRLAGGGDRLPGPGGAPLPAGRTGGS